MFNEYQPQVKVVSAFTAGTSSVFTGKGYLNSIFVNSHSSGIISIGNGTSSIINLTHSSITLGTGERELNFHGEPFEDGCFLNLGGTGSITVFYKTN